MRSLSGLVGLSILLVACGNEPERSGSAASGGGLPGAGATSGGVQPTGAVAGAGATTPVGGVAGTGDEAPVGGAATGGVMPNGGVGPTGGTAGPGGVGPTGGTAGSGGVGATGGSGGITPTGGAIAGGAGPAGTGNGGEDVVQQKDIHRVDVPDSPFKPTDLEATINDLVAALGEVPADDFPMSVVIKPFSDYWDPVTTGANRAMGELEIDGLVEAPADLETYEETTAAQIDIVQQRLDEGYGGLGLAAMSDDLSGVVNELVASGAAVVTLDSDLPDSNRQLYVGTDNPSAGTTGGQTLAALLSDQTEGSVIVFGTDDETWPDGYNRTMAAAIVLEEAGFTPILRRAGWTETDVATDLEVLPQLIADADPPVVGMIGMFYNAFRLAEVAEAEGFAAGEIAIVACDLAPETLTYMESGYIQATHVPRQYYMGYLVPYLIYSIRVLGIDETVSLLGDRMIDGVTFDTGLDVIEADQIEAYDTFLDDLGVN
jgi:ribose transport system substrate-binding protein